MVIVPVRSLSGDAQTTEVNEVSTWRLSKVYTLTERWLTRVIAVEADQDQRDEELRNAQTAQHIASKRWTTDFDEMVQQFYVRIEGTDIVSISDRLLARPSRAGFPCESKPETQIEIKEKSWLSEDSTCSRPTKRKPPVCS